MKHYIFDVFSGDVALATEDDNLVCEMLTDQNLRCLSGRDVDVSQLVLKRDASGQAYLEFPPPAAMPTQIL